jgi:hypothetical protein
MFRRKLYPRAAALPIPGAAVVIISQECMIDLNRERVGSAQEGSDRQKGRVEGWLGISSARMCASQRTPGEKRKGRALLGRCAALPLHHHCRRTRYTTETGTRVVREARTRNTEKRAVEEGEQKLWRAGSAVITSAGLNGGISRYLWHNFTGFTMAYIRGPAERISPRGTHICPTETFVLPLSRSRPLILSIIPPCWTLSLLAERTLPPPASATPYVFVHLVPNGNGTPKVFLIRP